MRKVLLHVKMRSNLEAKIRFAVKNRIAAEFQKKSKLNWEKDPTHQKSPLIKPQG